jgi:hypothetical protein
MSDEPQQQLQLAITALQVQTAEMKGMLHQEPSAIRGSGSPS